VSSKLIFLILALLTFLVTGCNISIQTDFLTATPPLIFTVTLPPPPTSHPSGTPLPPPPTSTFAPVQGITSTQLNVRAEPSTISEVLGVIAANQTVQIVGQDPDHNWWQILYDAGAEGKGWVTAQYIDTVSKPEVPVILGDGSTPDSGTSAVIIQQLNIRSGPGTSFVTIGILNVNDVVNLSGKNQDGTWLQIDFPAGPDGNGWVNSAFIKVDTLVALPIISELGEVLGTGTPLGTPPPPTPTIVPAPMDFDTANAPLKTILFDRVGTQTLIYNGDVSIPIGDTEDWVAFTPYGTSVFIQIQCNGNGMLHIELVGSDTNLSCNDVEQKVIVQAGIEQLVHLQMVAASNALQYVNYTLIIKASQ
jgi:uncharacterized protein YraI